MTVNFGGINKVSSITIATSEGKYVGSKVVMHLDNEGTPHLKRMQEYFKKYAGTPLEGDTLSVATIRPPHNPIDEAQIIVNNRPADNALINRPLFLPIIDILKALIKAPDEAIKPGREFVESGKLKTDLFGPDAGQFFVPKEVEDAAINPGSAKSIAKEIIQDIKINEAVDMHYAFKDLEGLTDIIPAKKKPELPN